MNQLEALQFVENEIEPRVFRKKLDDVEKGDWIRAVYMDWVTLDNARYAIRELVDSGKTIKVGDFRKLLYKHQPKELKIADQTSPVLLFEIANDNSMIRKDRDGNILIKAGTSRYSVGSESKVPPQPVIEQMAAEAVKRHRDNPVILWAKRFEPKLPF